MPSTKGRGSSSRKSWKCDKCEKVFFRCDLFKQHQQVHSDSKPYACTLCDETFKRKGYLNDHVRFLHRKDDKSLECELCHKRFKAKQHFNLHMMIHKGDKPYKCDICVQPEKYFYTISYLNLHNQSQHSTGEKQFPCEVCDKTFWTIGLRKVHMKCHERPHKCPMCPNLFSTKADALIHLRRIHIKEKYFSCYFCAKEFCSSNELRTHLRLHTKERPCKCPSCQKSFSNPSGLKQHIKSVHTAKNRKTIIDRKVVCKICNASLSSKAKLKSHEERMHSVNRQRSFICDICSKGFCFKTDLQMHKSTHSAKRFPCNLCDKSYKRETYLKVHFATIHSDDKSLECKLCYRRLGSKNSLYMHMRTHTAEKPYKCDLCVNVAFSTAIKLANHKKSHLKSKPVVVTRSCKICSKEYQTSSGYRYHMAIHHDKNDKKKFACQICQKQFTTNGYLNSHMKIHTRPHKCSICPKTVATNSELLRHVARHHTNEKYWKCYFCAKTFVGLTEFKGHLRVHTKEAPFKCGVCPLDYGSNSALIVHFKSKHVKPKLVKCYFCLKFKTADRLNLHLRMHLNERPYQCEVCFVGFVKNNMLNAHLKTIKCKTRQLVR